MRVFETPVDTYGRFFVLAHDDAGVGSADEVAAVRVIPISLRSFQHCILHCLAVELTRSIGAGTDVLSKNDIIIVFHCCPVDGGYDFSITLPDKGF
jgi:hypothetical protein